jgi:RNA polymerase sigma-70 factor (ECF subfamily)
MEPNDEARLTSISTVWTQLFRAHQERGDAVTLARQQLLLRYHRAAYRYLVGIVRDPAVAQELSQEFAVRFLRGDFRRVHPERGRFRDFLKAALRHLARDHWRQRGKAQLPLPEEEAGHLAAPAEDPADSDRAFLETWRAEVLARAWAALARAEGDTGRLHHLVLRARAERPQAPLAELASWLGEQRGKPVSLEAFRQVLHRARQQFADLLVAEVAATLAGPDPDELLEEIVALDLLAYCRSAVSRRTDAKGK